jgi:hypothetical protein
VRPTYPRRPDVADEALTEVLYGEQYGGRPVTTIALDAELDERPPRCDPGRVELLWRAARKVGHLEGLVGVHAYAAVVENA